MDEKQMTSRDKIITYAPHLSAQAAKLTRQGWEEHSVYETLWAVYSEARETGKAEGSAEGRENAQREIKERLEALKTRKGGSGSTAKVDDVLALLRNADGGEAGGEAKDDDVRQILDAVPNNQL
jgi:hypothetical protein